MTDAPKCPVCNDTGYVESPYIAGVVVVVNPCPKGCKPKESDND